MARRKTYNERLFLVVFSDNDFLLALFAEEVYISLNCSVVCSNTFFHERGVDKKTHNSQSGVKLQRKKVVGAAAPLGANPMIHMLLSDETPVWPNAVYPDSTGTAQYKS